MLLVAPLPPDAQKPGRVRPLIKTSIPNPFFFLLSYFCFIVLLICLQKSTDTRQKMVVLARVKHDSKRHSLTFPRSSANIQYQTCNVSVFQVLGRLTERLPSYHDIVTWKNVQTSSHACCFAILHNNVSILLLCQDYFTKAIVLFNLESFSGTKVLWPSSFLGWATTGPCSVFTWKASKAEKSQNNWRWCWWEHPARCCPGSPLDPFVSGMDCNNFCRSRQGFCQDSQFRDRFLPQTKEQLQIGKCLPLYSMLFPNMQIVFQTRTHEF